MRPFLLISVLIFAACEGGPADAQSAYRYAGCDDAGTYGCPNDLVFSCAMRAIHDRHDGTCQQAADCADVTLPNCMGVGVCTPVAVPVGAREAYLAEARAEIAHYCDGGTCHGSPSCVGVPERVDCIGGRCRWRMDGGI